MARLLPTLPAEAGQRIVHGLKELEVAISSIRSSAAVPCSASEGRASSATAAPENGAIHNAFRVAGVLADESLNAQIIAQLAAAPKEETTESTT